MPSLWVKLRSHIWIVLGIIISLSGVFLLSHLADSLFINLISKLIQRQPKPTWPHHLGTTGISLFLLGGLIIISDLYLFPYLHAFVQVIGRKISSLEDRIEIALSPSISFEDPLPSSLKKSKTINWVDILVGVVFLAAALFMFLSKIQGNYPHIIISGDAGNFTSFAAALDHPDFFKGDALLSNLENFRIYATINIPIIRWLNQYTGDYGLAFSYLLLPQVFIQLLGFYIFGRVLFKSRLWAFLFTLLVSMPVEINLQETWGVTFEPVPRFNYQALLPFLLSLAYLWRDRPRRWPWIMICAGLLVFVHPISSPAWGMALWLGFLPFLPQSWNQWKRLGVMLGLGMLFLAAASPYVIYYFMHHIQGKSADYHLIYSIMVNYFPENLLNAPAAMLTFLTRMFTTRILPGSIIGVFVLWLLLRRDRSPLKLVLSWVLGILLVSVFLPWIEQSIERFYRIIPIETELLRSIRYLIFFMLLFCIWPVAELNKRLKSQLASGIAIACGILIMGLWMTSFHPNTLLFEKTVACFRQGQLVCISPSDDAALIEAIKTKTPQDARFFASVYNSKELTFGIPIRSTALRSLVYSLKDRATMVFSNNQALETWYVTYRAIERIQNSYKDNYPEQIKDIVGLAENLGANYLVIDFPPPLDATQKYQLELIYQNPTYTLYKIRAP